MATAKKLPSGNWRCQAYDKTTGKRRSFTASTKKEAELLALEFMNGLEKKKVTERTVGECIDDYINSKENILSPSTISGYRKFKKNNLAELCGYSMCDLNTEIVQAYVNKLSLTLSPKSIHNIHGFLISVVNVYAPDLRIRTTLPKKQKKIKMFPKIEDIIKVIKGTEIELPCMLAIWLGMRMSEIRGAKKSNIHNGTLIIKEVVVTVEGQHIAKERTKTVDSTRMVSIPKYIQSLIDELPEEQDELTILSGHAIYNRFSRLLQNNNLPHISFHDLRHLNASTMLMLGIPDKYAMERGGWSSTNIMKSVYQHTFSEERQNVDKKIDNYFNELITE